MADDRQQWLASAFQRLLRPLVGMALRNGVMYREFATWCRRAYVDVAASDYGKRGRPTNQTRIALLTGIDRKQVKRLREDIEAGRMDAEARAARPGHLSRILTVWHTEKPWVDTKGRPKTLSQKKFTSLCEQVGGDVAPSAVTRELRESETIAVKDGKVRALRRYYMPQHAEPEAIVRGADVIADLAATVSYNIYRSEDQPSRFEGRATCVDIGADVLPDFRAFVEKRGQAFLEDIDLWLAGREKRAQASGPRLRLGVGAYWLQNDAEPQS